jgi:hypothetical protein
MPAMSKFHYDGSLSLMNYLRKFECYSENAFRGEKSLCDELGSSKLLEGETLIAFRNFKELGLGYRDVEYKLLNWYEDAKNMRKEKNR